MQAQTQTQILFSKNTQAIFYNNNATAIQRMLDYDYICRRDTPSVAAVVHPTSRNSFLPFFFGSEEVLIPVYRTLKDAATACPDADVLLNFASFRSAAKVIEESAAVPSIRVIVTTAEGIPERFARLTREAAKAAGKILIGPSTVGAIVPGAFKTANIGGSIDNIVKAKLHRPGSVSLITKSGGLFNELCFVLAQKSDGLAEGVSIGGDRYPGMSFADHLLRMENNPAVKMHVVLGEVGGLSEYEIIELKEAGRLTKPVVAFAIGTSARHFESGVQFGHAGAKADNEAEYADAKNKAMAEAGILVPEDFNELPALIARTYTLVQGETATAGGGKVPELPTDYNQAKKLGRVRKKTNFVCTISDDRGEEARYAGVPISELATPETGYGIGDVLCLLWFRRRYPEWATGFIESVLKTVADHGPAVSGAHNTRVTARAGKDLISSITTGLLTIGPRFGGAIDDAARYFKYGFEEHLSPAGFVDYMKSLNMAIPGIGHRIKSKKNPDRRVTELIRYARENFPETPLLDYALRVEEFTTSKKPNLILNVDGLIGVLLVDMWTALGYPRGLSEKEESVAGLIEAGVPNGLFALGRMIGFIGHALDEKRLRMPLYRHETDDILYKTTSV